MMTNKAMKLRHWNRISETTGHPFDVESDSFCLRNIMEAPLLKHKDDIEVDKLFFGLHTNFYVLYALFSKEKKVQFTITILYDVLHHGLICISGKFQFNILNI